MMWEKLEQISKRYQEIEKQIATPEVATDPKELQKLAQERAGIEDVVEKYREYKQASKSLEETKGMLQDSLDEEMKTMVRQEIEELEPKLENLLEELRLALLPRDKNDEKDIIVEIRAGAGGDEAGLFAAALFRMYSRYAQSKGWTVDIINANESGIGGFKEIIFEEIPALGPHGIPDCPWPQGVWLVFPMTRHHSCDNVMPVCRVFGYGAPHSDGLIICMGGNNKYPHVRIHHARAGLV